MMTPPKVDKIKKLQKQKRRFFASFQTDKAVFKQIALQFRN